MNNRIILHFHTQKPPMSYMNNDLFITLRGTSHARDFGAYDGPIRPCMFLVGQIDVFRRNHP
jgi:hypothetical protein